MGCVYSIYARKKDHERERERERREFYSWYKLDLIIILSDCKIII